MPEYIDKEKAIKEIDKGDLLVGNNAEWAKEIVYRTPTEDVIPVVRCKDCKHMHCYTDYTTKEKTYNCLKYGALNFVEGDHYCAYGERKDDNAK